MLDLAIAVHCTADLSAAIAADALLRPWGSRGAFVKPPSCAARPLGTDTRLLGKETRLTDEPPRFAFAGLPLGRDGGPILPSLSSRLGDLALERLQFDLLVRAVPRPGLSLYRWA